MTSAVNWPQIHRTLQHLACKITGVSDVVGQLVQANDLENFHYTDAIVSTMASEITSVRLFAQLFVQAQIKVNTKAPRHWPL